MAIRVLHETAGDDAFMRLLPTFVPFSDGQSCMLSYGEDRYPHSWERDATHGCPRVWDIMPFRIVADPAVLPVLFACGMVPEELAVFNKLVAAT